MTSGDTVQARDEFLHLCGYGMDGLIPLAFAERDARKAAAGEPSVYGWRCMRCSHEWGTPASVTAYADPAWCPQCQATLRQDDRPP
jgi:hypothetical protein